ncbi:MAG: carbohydrate ABC transporter substrate-binding protein [Ruminococcus sp.]|nr:carbohydrate ABC transporter substrate-binding protein [Ruminococcus sp.]
MKYTKNILAGIAALIFVTSTTVSCDDKKENKESEIVSEEQVIPTEPPTESPEDKAKNRTITWFSDFSLDTQDGGASPAALSLFRDFYGGDINFIQMSAEEKYSMLDYYLACGESVDMFPYDETAFPSGVKSNLFDPLDPYFDVMGVDDGLWDDMENAIDMFEYNGEHYVMPYDVASPDLIMYSRKLVEKEKLEDPYKLYLEGKWDWNVMLDMMSKFVSNPEAETRRYGISGDFGRAMLTSSGSTVVKYENDAFTNNIKDKGIAEAEKLMKKISDQNLYNPNWYEFYPNDNSTLFYAMGDWALGMTNAKNAKKDIMVVPFPKNPEAENYSINCDYKAKMLVKNSQNPEAVAAYLKCERVVAAEEKYRKLEKESLSVKEKDAYGKWIPYVTEEQYDAVQNYLDEAKKNPLFDFGYGMGENMYGGGDFTYTSRGVMNNLTESFLNGENAVENWDKMCKDMTKKVDKEIEKYNGQ